MSTQKRKDTMPQDFDAIMMRLASPERVLEWSHGEITKPETINYRTQRPEKNGLFDERVFGPEKDYECYCGKYRGIRFRGVICEKCGVEITRAIVRRERMGHIDLATPLSHIWFLRGVPSRIALLLGISATDVEKVVYFAGYIVTSVNEVERQRLLKELEHELKAKMGSIQTEEGKEELREKAKKAKHEIESIHEGVVLDEATYHLFAVKYGAIFRASIGAEALHDLLKKVDLDVFIAQLKEEFAKVGAADRDRVRKRLALAESLKRAGVRPEWMFITRLPIVPPALRPMVALEGGRHASSDLNDLYRRVINRNNRLKRLQAIHAPEVILRNEKRILQEAVDALIDNSMRRGAGTTGVMGGKRRTLKSLADYLKGKHGYLRQNLLGKRVDYSGRSVIVVGPDLSLDECGLPKNMALELFRPFVIAGLLAREHAFNIRGAGRLIEDEAPEIWPILEEAIKGKYVLLNRAPTLHRQSIQAFRPVLIDGRAIQLHPMACQAFNADFDGDTMSVHVPLSEAAQLEAKEIMSANKNILKPGSGDITAEPRQDMILGCFWMTQMIEGAKGEGKTFPSPNTAITAYDFGGIDLRAKVVVLPTDSKKYAQFEGKVFETSVGRLLFNSVLPTDFPYINDEITKKRMGALMRQLVVHYSLDGIPPILDKIKKFGFRYATFAGITFSAADVAIPEAKADLIKEARGATQVEWNNFNEGLLTADERTRRVIEIWSAASNRVRTALIESLAPESPVQNMIISGARGSAAQLHQMAGMKGLITNPRGEIIEFPITASLKEGLTPIEYFISTHGSRKGLADTALNTARAGYLTRRLFDVAHDVVILEDDCHTKEGITLERPGKDNIGGSFTDRLTGRVLAEDVVSGGKTLFARGHMLHRDDAAVIEKSDVQEATVRSPMTCKVARGVCQKCYGADLGTGDLIDYGEAIGVVAAQAIGEPGTQLTMRTFHTGGVATAGGDITMGLPRVEEIFECRMPKVPATIAHVSGTITDIIKDGVESVIVILPEVASTGKTARAAKKDAEYRVHPARLINVKVGQHVEKGQFLTDGSADLDEMFLYAGKEATQNYIIGEVMRIYELQGVGTGRKHLEIIVKQMFSRVSVTNAGDTGVSVGEIITDFELERINTIARDAAKEPAKAKQLLMGITEVSLTRASFLSAISFQNTPRKLAEASVSGAMDRLVGLKENVIIGRLIPVGTGYEGSKKHALVEKMERDLAGASDVTDLSGETAEV